MVKKKYNLMQGRYFNYIQDRELEELCLTEKIMCLQYIVENFKVSAKQLKNLIEAI